MTKHDAFATAKIVRQLDKALETARSQRDDLCRLLSEDGLRGLSTWGRHNQCPTPFWIEVTEARRVFASKGVKPRFWERGSFLQLPSANWYESISVI